MPRPSPLDDSTTAAHAWARWRRMMRLMAWVALATVAAVLAGFYALGGPDSIHFYIAVALGIGATMMMGGALMGLVFLSSGTGHDEVVGDD